MVNKVLSKESSSKIKGGLSKIFKTSKGMYVTYYNVMCTKNIYNFKKECYLLSYL